MAALAGRAAGCRGRAAGAGHAGGGRVTTAVDEQATRSAVPIAADDFYHMPDGSKLIRVTSVIEYGVPRPALVDWAAREVAKCAMAWLTRLARARTDKEREATLNWLKEAAKRQRDAAARLGSVVHDLAEA